MHIAEEIVRAGITSGQKFNDKLTEFVKLMGFKKIVETGTYHGTGTTRAIISGCVDPFELYTIEVNPENFKIAFKNLSSTVGVNLLNGLSVGRPDLPVSISADIPEFVIIDHQPKDRMALYNREVSYKVPDDMLDYAMSKFDYQPDFMLLDSAGYMGFIELMYVLNRLQGDCYIALDDTDHIKHYESMQFIALYPDKFEIIWKVRSELIDKKYGDKFGSAIVKYTHR